MPSDDMPPELVTQIARFRELRERGEAVKQQLAETEATAHSRSGAVEVTVGAGGVMRQLRLGEPARKLPLEKLSSDIMQTYLAAGRDAARQGVAIMSTLVGPDSPTLQLMRDAIPPDPDAEHDAEGRTQ